MREFLALQQRFRGSLFLQRDVHRNANDSRRRSSSGLAVPATARGHPTHRAIGQDYAKLGLITARRQRALDRGGAHGAIVGMDTSAQGRVIDRLARLEAEDLQS